MSKLSLSSDSKRAKVSVRQSGAGRGWGTCPLINYYYHHQRQRQCNLLLSLLSWSRPAPPHRRTSSACLDQLYCVVLPLILTSSKFHQDAPPPALRTDRVAEGVHLIGCWSMQTLINLILLELLIRKGRTSIVSSKRNQNYGIETFCTCMHCFFCLFGEYNSVCVAQRIVKTLLEGTGIGWFFNALWNRQAVWQKFVHELL